MKLFDIFDQQGNKIGEITDSSTECGCGAFSIIIMLIIGTFSILGWPLFLREILRGIENQNTELLYVAIPYLIIIISVLIWRIVIRYKKPAYSFLTMWGETIFWISLIAGVGYWIITGIGEDLSLISLLASIFMSFVLSVSCGLVAATLTMIIRKIQFKSRE